MGNLFDLGRSTFAKSSYFDPAPQKFEVMQEFAEIAVAAADDHRIEFGSLFDGIHGDTDIPVGFFLAAVKYLEVFGFYLDTDIFERFEKSLFLWIFSSNGIGNGPYQDPIMDNILNDRLKIYFFSVNRLGRVIEILHIDKYPDALMGL